MEEGDWKGCEFFTVAFFVTALPQHFEVVGPCLLSSSFVGGIFFFFNFNLSFPCLGHFAVVL